MGEAELQVNCSSLLGMCKFFLAISLSLGRLANFSLVSFLMALLAFSVIKTVISSNVVCIAIAIASLRLLLLLGCHSGLGGWHFPALRIAIVVLVASSLLSFS